MALSKACTHCTRGTQTARYAPRPYPCEDCRGKRLLYYCETCGGWLDSASFDDPDSDDNCAECANERNDHE